MDPLLLAEDAARLLTNTKAGLLQHRDAIACAASAQRAVFGIMEQFRLWFMTFIRMLVNICGERMIEGEI